MQPNYMDSIAQLLVKNNMTISTAESCTGGMLAQQLTVIPGSSKYYLGSIIAYDNKIKVELLGVSTNLLEKYGAVSKEVGIEMAKRIRILTGSDLGVGITGLAGPGGGSIKKPIGLVYVALDTPYGCNCIKSDFNGDRETIRNKSSLYAQYLVWKYLQSIEV
ncbi:MAG: CinA family protein [Clostridia bacterium]|nr:CinA family protein [Clostridia bacterium]MDD4047638.1 CinA family protein [Clostridia bacterium]